MPVRRPQSDRSLTQRCGCTVEAVPPCERSDGYAHMTMKLARNMARMAGNQSGDIRERERVIRPDEFRNVIEPQRPRRRRPRHPDRESEKLVCQAFEHQLPARAFASQFAGETTSDVMRRIGDDNPRLAKQPGQLQPAL